MTIESELKTVQAEFDRIIRQHQNAIEIAERERYFAKAYESQKAIEHYRYAQSLVRRIEGALREETDDGE